MLLMHRWRYPIFSQWLRSYYGYDSNKNVYHAGFSSTLRYVYDASGDITAVGYALGFEYDIALITQEQWQVA